MTPNIVSDAPLTTLLPQDASILSAIACDPTIREVDPAVYDRLVRRLETPFAEEVARALAGESAASREAADAAAAMLDWVRTKQEQLRRTRERFESGRFLRVRALRPRGAAADSEPAD